MSFLITHYFDGATQEQYDAITAKAHNSDGSLPAGQLHHFAGPAANGFLVVAVWETKELNDEFQAKLGQVIGDMDDPPSPPEERTADITNEVHA